MTSSFSDKGRASVLDQSAEISRSEIKIIPPTCDNIHKNKNITLSKETKLTVPIILRCLCCSWFIVKFDSKIWQLCKRICAIIIFMVIVIIIIIVIAELVKFGKESLINSKSKVLSLKFYVFFRIINKYIRNRVLAPLKIEKLLELQEILSTWKEKLSLHKKQS